MDVVTGLLLTAGILGLIALVAGGVWLLGRQLYTAGFANIPARATLPTWEKAVMYIIISYPILSAIALPFIQHYYFQYLPSGKNLLLAYLFILPHCLICASSIAFTYYLRSRSYRYDILFVLSLFATFFYSFAFIALHLDD